MTTTAATKINVSMPDMRHMRACTSMPCHRICFTRPAGRQRSGQQRAVAVPAAAVVCRDIAISVCFIPRKQTLDGHSRRPLPPMSEIARVEFFIYW